MAGRSNSYTRWGEHLTACFSRGVREFNEGFDKTDCPYVGEGFNRLRREQWVRGFEAAEKSNKKQEV